MDRLNKMEEKILNKINRLEIINDYIFLFLIFIIVAIRFITQDKNILLLSIPVAICYVITVILLKKISLKVLDVFLKEKLNRLEETFNKFIKE